MALDQHIRDAVERATGALRAQLEKELGAIVQQLKHQADAHVNSVREAAQRDADALKQALADERGRAAQAAAETAAAEMRRQAETQAQIVQVQENARLQIQEMQQAAADERGRAVQQAADSAMARARREAEAEIAKLRDAAQAHAAELRGSFQAQVSEVRRTADEQVEETRRAAHAEVEEARRHALALADDVKRRADEQAEETRRDAEAQIEEMRRRNRAEIDGMRAEVEKARADAAAAVTASRAEAEDVVIAQLTAAHADAERKIEDAIDRTRTNALQAELAQASRLVDAIRRLDEARSLGEALDSLAESAGRHVERAALLVVRGDKLRLHRLAGFNGAAAGVDLDVQSAGLAGAVVSTGVTVSRTAVEPGDEQVSRQPALPSFAQDAGVRHAVAIPIIVGGRAVAVLYADAPRADAPASAGCWPATLEVLVRHASRALEAMTVQRAAGLSLPRTAQRSTLRAVPGPVEHGGTGDEDAARRYARLLVSEIRMYHEPVVDAGRRSRDLRSRLGGEIDRARRMYEERVSQTIRDRSDFFEQELIRTLADGDRSLLG